MQYRSVGNGLLGLGAVLFAILPAHADVAAGMRAFQEKDYTTAFNEWKAAAEAGQAEAQFDLGVLYAQGRGVKRDLTQAEQWYRKAATQGNAEAQFALGQMYARGWGVPRDEADAMRWFQMANAPDTGGPATAWATIEGYGVEKDEKQAAYWYEQAAQKGHPEAQFQLAHLYSSGKGVLRDDEQAVRWTRAAAGRGYAPAQAALGTRYAHGQGMDRDDKRAYFWLTVAWLHGEKSVEKLRTEESGKLAPADVSAADKSAQNWKPRIYAAQKK
jgi:TPR repeat protein